MKKQKTSGDIAQQVQQLYDDTAAWQATLDEPRMPTRAKQADKQEQNLAGRLVKMRLAHKSDELTTEQKTLLASLPGLGDFFVTDARTEAQRLRDDLLEWQREAGNKRIPKRADGPKARALAERCAEMADRINK